jgi:hypothetical protein
MAILVFVIKENASEFVESDNIVFLSVMLSHNLIKLLLGNRLTDFVHGSDDVFLGNDSRIVRIELIEDCLKRCVIHELEHVHSCNQELSIVNFLVAKVVHF